MPTGDPYESFRKSKSQGFITRMKARDKEREKERKTGGGMYYAAVECVLGLVFPNTLICCSNSVAFVTFPLPTVVIVYWVGPQQKGMTLLVALPKQELVVFVILPIQWQ